MSDLVKESEEKIQFIVDNEYSEIADGFGGLQLFIDYCLSEDLKEDLYRAIENDLQFYYKDTKQRIQEEEELQLKNTYKWKEVPPMSKVSMNNQIVFKVADKCYDYTGLQVDVDDDCDVIFVSAIY